MRTASLEVDARNRPLAARLRMAFEAFDALREGDSFLFRTNFDPRPVYDGFRVKHPDTFGWSAVVDRPVEREIEIFKLKPKETEDQLGAYFARDHDEIDVLFSHLRSDLAAAISNPPGGAWLIASFDEFDSRLERHIRWEEEALFPAVEAKASDLARGPGRIMREEHELIRKFKSEARLALAEGKREQAELEAVVKALEEMQQVLLDHNLKEEAVYYPMSDEMLSPAEAAQVLARVRTLAAGGVA